MKGWWQLLSVGSVLGKEAVGRQQAGDAMLEGHIGALSYW